MTGKPSRALQWTKAVGIVLAAFVGSAMLAASVHRGAWMAAVVAVVAFGMLMIRPERSFAGFSPQGNRKVGGAVAALLVLLALVPASPKGTVQTAALPGSRAAVSRPSAQEPNAAGSETAPTSGLKLVTYRWRADGFGTVMMVDATIRNTGATAVKDMGVHCTTFGASGTELGQGNQTIYDVVEPGQTRRFRNVNLGFINAQAARAECKLMNASTLSS